jgi:TFIIF-interacting CTD phosphatase-like protein
MVIASFGRADHGNFPLLDEKTSISQKNGEGSILSQLKAMSRFLTWNSPRSVYPKSNKCIVLDLDATLVHTQNTMQGLSDIPDQARGRVYVIAIDDGDYMWGIERPGVKEFLEFVFEHFLIVAIWSAGKRNYVEAIVNRICRDGPSPHAIFTYDDTLRAQSGLYKPLRKMWIDDVLSQFMNEKNTLIVDDNEMTFELNPHNALHIPEYRLGPGEEKDDALSRLMHWMESSGVLACEDVREIEKGCWHYSPS